MHRHPHANLSALHYVAFMAAMLAVYGWGLAVLKRDLAASATTTIIAER